MRLAGSPGRTRRFRRCRRSADAAVLMWPDRTDSRYFGTTLGLPPGVPGGGITGVEVGPGSGGVTCILGSMLPPGLITPRDWLSLSLGLSPGADDLPCAAAGSAYASDSSAAIVTTRNALAMSSPPVKTRGAVCLFCRDAEKSAAAV